MRHDKAGQVLRLARLLAASAEGMTLSDMARAMEVGRRTAERMRDAVRELFPELEEIDEPPTRRFRIPAGLDGVFQSPDAEDMATLRGAAEMLEGAGAKVRADVLRGLESKIMAAARASARRRIAPDLEALVQAETIAVHAGPRPFEDAAVLATVREAIKSLSALSFIYDGGRTPGRRRLVTPYGVLFGRSNYLVAAEIADGMAGESEARSWRFDRMREVAPEDIGTSAPADFSLADFAQESFGIYHGEMQDVVLRVRPERAADALAWRFHAHQRVETLPDGSVRIAFRAGGMLELAWHLFTWGDAIEILGPTSLRALMVDELERALARHRAAPL